MKLSEKEKNQYLNAISKEIFRTKFKKLTEQQVVTLRTNLIARKLDEEFGHSVYEQLDEMCLE